MPAPIRTALLGYGVSGRVFHAPLIAADPQYSLDAIVTGDPGRAARAAGQHPGARVVPSGDELFALVDAGELELDLVVLGTPPGTHFAQAGAAIERGLHVVVDKPFVPTAAQGEELVRRAAAAGVVLTVFQNRRWDADFLTLRKLVEAGALGDVRTFESRFEWWMPEGFGSWKDEAPVAEAGGILHDLGAHLVDQALQLFGPVRAVHAEAARHGDPGVSDADQDTFVSLLHESGVRSRLWMNGLAAQVGPRFHVLGSEAAYTKWGLDGQEPALDAGTAPTDPGYGVEPEDRWGVLGAGEDLAPVPAERGDYPAFYRRLAACLRQDGPVPVDPADAVEVLRVIERVHGLN
jgi:predicted dehydrogenase